MDGIFLSKKNNSEIKLLTFEQVKKIKVTDVDFFGKPGEADLTDMEKEIRRFLIREQLSFRR